MLLGLNILLQLFAKPIWPLPAVSTATSTMASLDHRQQLDQLHFWRDKFLHSVDIKNESGEIIARRILLVDPETGEATQSESTYPGGVDV